MMNLKSDRLKKLELELQDLEKWLELGLVPKKDIDKHKEEILVVKQKIDEEKSRLRFIKETGDMQDYVIPKKAPTKQIYPETHTISDMDISNDTEIEESELFDIDTDQEETAQTSTFEEEEEEENPFSDKNRWKRGILEDPDADNW